MKKVNLVLSLFVLTLNSCDKQGSINNQRNYRTVANTVSDKSSEGSQHENLPVQLRKAGKLQMNFSSLRQALGKIDIANYVIGSNTQVVLIETSNLEENVKGFSKMDDNFNSLNASDNEALMQSYQSYADENCEKIYGCVGTSDDGDYDWKIIKFLPNPERCTLEPTVTMSSVMLYK